MLKKKPAKKKTEKGKIVKKQEGKCYCPYCEEELLLDCMSPIFCKPCQIEFVACRNCGELFNIKTKTCPQCGVLA